MPGQLLMDHFAIKADKITTLEGYDSINYKIECASKTYVLKQYEKSIATRELLTAENEILNILAEIAEYEFPIAIPHLPEKYLLEEGTSIYRLLSYVEGEFLGDVAHPPELLRSFGQFLAEMDKCLITCSQVAIRAKEIQWDLRHFHLNYKFLKYIPKASDRSLIDYFFLQFEEQLHPLRSSLRMAVIHNDANHWNVLTKNGKVSGIIDFGDMCHTWLINELAVALTYIMMQKEHPLQAAIEVIGAYHKVLPLKIEELDILYYLITARLCTSICNSAYTKTIKPDSDYITVSEQPAWELLRILLATNPIAAKDAFRTAAGFPKCKKPTLQRQLRRRDQSLSKSFSLSYKTPIQMERSAFQYMYDTQGNTILDAYNNIMLAGHCHPSVVRKGQRALAKLNTNTRYVFEEILSYSEKLLAKFPSKLNKVFFVNSGSAASDLAIRLATNYTGKNKIMALEHGYHGNTRMGIAISHYKYSHAKGIGKQPSVIAAPMPKAFGSGFKDDGTAGAQFAGEAIKLAEAHKNEIAAFIAEPIVGCGGQVPLAKGYLKEVYPKIRAAGGICISDEVQVGFGRLGECFWGFEMHGVIPDIVILGKPMGNGHPMGAVVTTEEIAKKFEDGPEFFSSFGGNPVSCAIGEAVLDVIEEEQLQEHASLVGKYLKESLLSLQEECIEIADVRGSGLFLGIELLKKDGAPHTKLASYLKNGLRKKFILVSTDGPFDNIIKVKPPLSFNIKDADKLVNTMASILKKF